MIAMGIDYAWSRPTTVAMRNAGASFVCRYLSHDTTGKNITRAEAETLTAAGLWIVLVWESSTGRMLAGSGAGQADAIEALKQATAVGMPDGRPIYFALDFDATAQDQPAVHAYLDGAASVIGRNRLGMYSGYGPMVRAFDQNKIAYGWQTYAWSAGQWDSRAQLQQYQNEVILSGADVDLNHAVADDYGQWKIGASPDMAFTDADKKYLEALFAKIPKAVWTTDNIIPAADDSNPGNKFWGADFHLSSAGRIIREIAARPTDDTDETAIIAGVLAGLSPQTLANMIADQLGPEVAQATVDALTSRLSNG
jgi:hypothetical protein